MDKKEIIKLLDKEVGLFYETEDENSLGELYLTEIQFKDAEGMLKRLQKSIVQQESLTKKLKEVIEGNDRFTIWKDVKITEGVFVIKDQIITLDSTFISNCVFNTK